MSAHVAIELFESRVRPRSPESVAAQRMAATRARAACAMRAGAPADGWARDEKSVPLPNAGWRWSLAHKHDVAAVAIARAAVGVDVERILPRSENLLNEIASDEEWKLFSARDWPNAYRIWTAKETVLKAVGVGLAGLDRCRVMAVQVDGWSNKDSCFSDAITALQYGGELFRARHFSVDDVVVAVVCQGDGAIQWHVIDRRGESGNQRDSAAAQTVQSRVREETETGRPILAPPASGMRSVFKHHMRDGAGSRSTEQGWGTNREQECQRAGESLDPCR